MSTLSDSGRRSLLYVVDLLRGGFSGRVTLVCCEGGVRSIRTRRSFRGSGARELVEETKATLATAGGVLRSGFSGDLVFEAEEGVVVDFYEEVVARPKDLPLTT